MKWIPVLLLSLLGVVLVSQVEAAGRFKCGKNMEEVYSPDSGRYYCRPKKVKPPEPPKAPAPVLPPLTIDRFEPTSLFGGEELTIYGSGFTQGRIRAVYVGGAGSLPKIISQTELKTVVSVYATTGVVSLEPNSGSKVSSSKKLEVRKELMLIKVEPSVGKAGIHIQIYAKGGKETDRCKINIGGIHSATYLYHSGAAMDVAVPQEAKNGEIFIDCGEGGQVRNNNLFRLLVEAKPPPPPPPSVTPPAPPPSPPPVAEKPKVTPPPQEITRNALGDPELCFGAVGKGCGGFDDLKEGEKKETHPLWFTAGCSVEVAGMRRCWVVPGSIKHDNCCVKHPSGKQCGGPGRNPFNRSEPDKDWVTGKINKAGEWNHDNNCVQEWDDAVWDVKNGRGWEVDFPPNTPANLTPAVSPSGRYSGGEVAASVSLCASNGSSISARHNVAFCCSGNAKKYWALGVEDWLICEPKSAGRNVQRVASKQKGTPPPKLDMTKPPSKPGQPKTVDTKALAPVTPRSPVVQPQPALLPPPPPPSQMAKEKPAVLPQPALTPQSGEPEQKWAAPEESEGAEEIAVEKKQEPELAERPPAPQEEATAPHCERGTWSPTFRRCIEEEAPSESLQRACETGTHWSPTLKSCQSD